MRATSKTALNFDRSVGPSVRRSGEVTRTSRCLFSFVTRARPSQPFYALRAIPKTALNFGWLVGGSVSRSQGSHTNVMLPLQFRHPGPPFPILLCPAGLPQNGLKFWLIGRSRGSHTNVTLPLQFHHPGPSFPTLLSSAGHPQNGLKFWLIGWSVSWSVTGKSHERHAASSVLSPGPALPDPSTPCRPPPKRPYFWLVSWSVTGKSHKRHAASSVSSPGPALPDPFTPCGLPPKRP
jgi:hypothetical protein